MLRLFKHLRSENIARTLLEMMIGIMCLVLHSVRFFCVHLVLVCAHALLPVFPEGLSHFLFKLQWIP